MRVYFAGNTCAGGEDPLAPEKSLRLRLGRRLLSYHITINDVFHSKAVFDMNLDGKVDLFLDSGAFSAWTQGAPIDIQKYIEFIHEHKDLLTVYANLDVIGIGGKQPNALTAKKTLENQKIMEKAGLKPLPVFHFGEPEKYLKYYVDRYEYLAMGVAGNVGSKLIPWLDRCFSEYICDSNGMPRIKTHGFAVTGLQAMLRYPWYSVDSTSWVMTSRLGSIYVPISASGKPEYSQNSLKVSVSSRSPASKDAGRHFTSLNRSVQERILAYVHEKGFIMGKSSFTRLPKDAELAPNQRWAESKGKAGKNGSSQEAPSLIHVGHHDETTGQGRLVETIEEEGLCNKYQLRDALNAQYFIDLQKYIPEWPWPFKLAKAAPGLTGLL